MRIQGPGKTEGWVSIACDSASWPRVSPCKLSRGSSSAGIFIDIRPPVLCLHLEAKPLAERVTPFPGHQLKILGLRTHVMPEQGSSAGPSSVILTCLDDSEDGYLSTSQLRSQRLWDLELVRWCPEGPKALSETKAICANPSATCASRTIYSNNANISSEALAS